ncbi:MAG: SAM-dependent methyltransferase [Candidatus Saccharibacteria bacterium]|nr:SAM-dependent methyltransferase [Candidatus Saccharibacteria bacterium]
MHIVRERSSRSPKREEGDGPGGGLPLSVSEVGEEKVRQDPRSGTVRGYQKIKDAAEAFNYDFRGKTVLDIGSSTGGFTKYALDHGAKQVIAIEKGTNQLMHPLRHDPRVELHEKTDIFDVSISEEGDGIVGIQGAGDGHGRDPAELAGPKGREDATGGKCPAGPAHILDVIVADVSFVSLTKILAYAKANLSGHHTDFLVMLKPQFEAKPSELNSGIVKNDKIRRQIIKNFEHWLKQNNFVIIDKHDNQLKGKTGNQERFYYLKLAK